MYYILYVHTRSTYIHCCLYTNSPLQVEFVGEEGMDAGGVQKEFFLLLLKDILNPQFGMFQEDDESNFIWFSDEVSPCPNRQL